MDESLFMDYEPAPEPPMSEQEKAEILFGYLFVRRPVVGSALARTVALNLGSGAVEQSANASAERHPLSVKIPRV